MDVEDFSRRFEKRDPDDGERSEMREAAMAAGEKLPGCIGVVLVAVRVREGDNRLSSCVELITHQSMSSEQETIISRVARDTMAEWLGLLRKGTEVDA